MNTETLTTRFRRFVIISLMMFTFGGFVFYAGVVVPTGSSVLDSTTQGFVTRRVTNTINLAVAVTSIGLLWEYLAGQKLRSRLASRTLGGCGLFIGLTCGALIWLHPQLDALLIPQDMDVLDSGKFYSLHRIYLWLSTLQWLSSIPVTWIIINAHRPNSQGSDG